MKKSLILTGLLSAVLFCSCEFFSAGSFVVQVDFSDTQYDQTASPWIFSILFNSGAIAGGANDISHGPSLGATIVTVNVTTNETFYVTAARVDYVQYRPELASNHVDYISPILGRISPISANIPTSYENGALEMKPAQDNVFEVYLATEANFWSDFDFDGDATVFPDDTDEMIELKASLFLEGYLADGTEFSGNFPEPLHLDITISHDGS